MRSLRLFVPMLIGAAIAYAGDEPPVGQQAKEFKVTDCFNMVPAANPLHALKGRAVLLTAFETRNSNAADAIADMNGIHDKYGPQGLTILAFSEQDKASFQQWFDKAGVKFSWVLIDTPTAEQNKRDWPFPGQPWSFLIDPAGKVVWQENPRNMQNKNVLKPGTLEPLLKASWKEPFLPPALAGQQKLLDDGVWAQAKTALDAIAAAGKLDKADIGWAKGVSAWIVQRHDRYLADADALTKQGWWWDAWNMMDEFPRKFEGMDGADAAKAKAEEIRKNPEAAKDLAAGDDVAKAKELFLAKKYPNARLVLQRILKERKGTRHADRAQELMDKLPPK
jgi:hypothetical protein